MARYRNLERGVHNNDIIDATCLTSIIGTGKVAEAFYTGEYNEYPYVSPLLSLNEESKEACKDVWLDRPSYMSRETRLVNLSQDHFLFDWHEIHNFTTANCQWDNVLGWVPAAPWNDQTWPEEHMNISQKDASEMCHLLFKFHRRVHDIHYFLVTCKFDHLINTPFHFTDHILSHSQMVKVVPKRPYHHDRGL